MAYNGNPCPNSHFTFLQSHLISDQIFLFYLLIIRLPNFNLSPVRAGALSVLLL